MNDAKYIGLDVHQATISVAVRDAAGKLAMEAILETKADTILQFLRGLHGSLHVTLEEGTCTAWLHDLFKPRALERWPGDVAELADHLRNRHVRCLWPLRGCALRAGVRVEDPRSAVCGRRFRCHRSELVRGRTGRSFVVETPVANRKATPMGRSPANAADGKSS
jgi:hypothetical protein